MGNPLSSRIDRTQLHMVSRDVTASMAHSMLFPVNNEKGELVAAGAALLFAVIAERTGMEPEDLFRLGQRILMDPSQHHTKTNASLEALRDFAGLRINVNPTI